MWYSIKIFFLWTGRLLPPDLTELKPQSVVVV